MRKFWYLIFIIFFFSSCADGLNEIEKNDIKIFEDNKDSVVYISTTKKVVDYSTLTRHTVPKGSGSGFIWDKKGHIVTNYHVIAGANSAIVKLSSGKTYNAYLVGAYPRRDIAVLKISAPKRELKPVKLGSSSNLKVGQSVYAIGNPFGLDWSMSKGIVSALNREVPSDDGLMMSGAIQTDAAINPGNSGGVMLNSSGKVIGVNSAIYSPNGANVGIGFAIPIDLVKRVVNKIIKYGKYIKPSLGIESDERINRYLQRNLGIRGVAILRVIKGSGAEAAGLRGAKFYMDGTIDFGDIILGVNGKRVENIMEIDDVLEKLKVGDVVTLKILRRDKIVNIPVKLMGLEG